MKAVRLVQPGRPLELHDVPLPRADDDDVVLRVKAAGICHSDAHYRAGTSRVHPLPLTLGHEVAGVVDRTGPDVKGWVTADRVCVHYLVTGALSPAWRKGKEQFCATAAMIGKHR